MLAKDMPSESELTDPAYVAWWSMACKASMTVDAIQYLSAHLPQGRAYAAAIEALSNRLPVSEYGAAALGRFRGGHVISPNSRY
jgi:hypothetical protein